MTVDRAQQLVAQQRNRGEVDHTGHREDRHVADEL